MPASLRPNLLATLTLATTVSMTGCIFPFTRSSDTKLTELVTEDSQPQPVQQAAAAPKPVGEKKMPPFARFLGGMFGGEGAPQAEAEPEPDPINTQASEPVQRVATLPATTPAPQPSAIQPAQDLVKTSPQTPIFNPKTNNMPVVVTPETNTMADKPDVVSSFTQKPTQLVDAPRPEVVVQPMPTSETQPPQQAPAQAAPAPQVAKTTPVKLEEDALDAHARAPWGEKKLLQKAMANSSTNTTTLEHSLDLALETVRRERLGEQPAPAVEATTPQPELTAHADVKAEPALPAQTPATQQPTKMAANPLRSYGTKTDWTGSSLRDSQPQMIENNTLTKYPQTDSKWSPKLPPSTPAPEEVVKQEEPAAEPQVTVNPYAKTVSKTIAATPAAAPQLADNAVATAEPTNEQPATTDDIHFQSSLLTKLQAANRQAKWDFDSQPQPPAQKAEIAAKTTSAMPQIVEKEIAKPTLPLVAAEEPKVAPAEPVAVQPKTTINPSVAQTEPKEVPQVIQPFIIEEPARVAPVQRGLVRAAEPQPLVIDNQHGKMQNASPTTARPMPKLAPVVRASEYQKPLPQAGGSKTYIVN
ncbi:hypothetical protein C5Y96_21165 [Blastopirellula marina]|uniref:Uncharacterized protein n=1 Tax=Blastopirellula marina TaxID=124 RepID=A0A2S8F229_9BACT|nr:MULTISPECIES: hypothetical protein [Pirellulaceae]PQO25964.1 hypothetical protein C5Y96_21165 [Blastopirellula marina]RCS44322.1 hypothetical protein DTL36_21210 [Bremerella cremea]